MPSQETTATARPTTAALATSRGESFATTESRPRLTARPSVTRTPNIRASSSATSTVSLETTPDPGRDTSASDNSGEVTIQGRVLSATVSPLSRPTTKGDVECFILTQVKGQFSCCFLYMYLAIRFRVWKVCNVNRLSAVGDCRNLIISSSASDKQKGTSSQDSRTCLTISK